MGNKQTSKLRPEVIHDLLEETKFSEEEIKKWYREFLKDFPNGQLSIDQFKDVYIQHFPNGDATKFSEHVFRTFDKDDDRMLDFREFLSALSVTARGGPSERLRWAFQMYDIDENGYISKEECTEIIKAMFRLMGARLSLESLDMTPAERTQQAFQLLDVNGDGKISIDEFVQGAHADPGIIQMLEHETLYKAF